MNINAFLITTLAGFSTLLGFFILWMKRGEKVIPSALGFSAGIMLYVSFFDLIPSSLYYFHETFLTGFHILFCLLFVLLGILISTYMNELIHKNVKGDSLYQIGFLSMVVLMLHNIPEGIITYLTSTIEWDTGLFLALSIACHNIPEGICIAIPIYYSTNSKKKAFFMVLISALSEPIGALLAFFFLENHLTQSMIGIFLAFVSGIMISLSLTEILPEAKKYSLQQAIKYMILGVVLLFFSHLLF